VSQVSITKGVVPGMVLLAGALVLATVLSSAAAETPAPNGKASSEAGLGDLGKKDDKLPSDLGLKDQSAGRLLGQSLAAVAVILVLGGVGLVVVKRLMPRLAAARGKRVLLLETFHLGPQRALHVVQVGNRSLLVGSSREGLNLLADVTEALPPPEIDLGAARPKARFVIPPLGESGDGGGEAGVKENDH